MFDSVSDELQCTQKILEQRNKDCDRLRGIVFALETKLAMKGYEIQIDDLRSALLTVRNQTIDDCATAAMSCCMVIEEPHEFERCRDAILALKGT